MTATKPKKPAPASEQEIPPKPLLTKLTEEAVLARLGRPVDLDSVAVHRYDSSRCRVNVRRKLTKADAIAYFRSKRVSEENYRKTVEGIDHSMDKAIVIITDSFYLRTNYDGSLRSDNEPIERKY